MDIRVGTVIRNYNNEDGIIIYIGKDVTGQHMDIKIFFKKTHVFRLSDVIALITQGYVRVVKE